MDNQEVRCKHCGSTKTQYRGTRRGAFGIVYHRYMCRECGKWDKRTANGSYAKQPKILLFDIECAPMEVYVWELKQDGWIPPSSIIQDWCVLSWSAKWLYSGQAQSAVLTPDEAIARNDKRILLPMWELLNEAQVVVTHNGNRFDLKKLNTRFLLHGFPPPHSYQSVDTLAVAKKHFAFSSNSLDYINRQLGLPTKLGTNFDLWKRCVRGEQEALDYMVEYNREDVFIMEETYLTLRPWISNHPNLALLSNMDGAACPVCQSTKLRVESVYSTHLSQYQEYRCQSCGAIGRGRTNMAPKNKKRIRPLTNPYPRSIPKVSGNQII